MKAVPRGGLLLTNPSRRRHPTLATRLTSERIMNYVPFTFSREGPQMFRAVIEEAATFVSLSLFIGMIAVWAQVLTVL